MGSELTLPISRWSSSCKDENGKAQQQGRPVGSPLPREREDPRTTTANLPGGANLH